MRKRGSKVSSAQNKDCNLKTVPAAVEAKRNRKILNLNNQT